MMKYKKRHKYKYTLVEDFEHLTNFLPPKPIQTQFISINNKGVLKIKKGYAWDGPSGPALDTKNFMKGSLIHDALYQLMREKFLDLSYRKSADILLKETCINSGMSRIIASFVYIAVRLCGIYSARPDIIIVE